MESKSYQLNISYRQIIKLALPISASLIIPQINFITNNIFLGHLGKQELALAGITGVYYLIFAVIGHGLNNGLQTIMSRRAGENRLEEIGKNFRQGVIIAFILSFLGIVFTYTVTPLIFKSIMHSNEHYALCISFLKIRIWGLPFLYLYLIRNALFVSINLSKLLMYGTIAETATNILLDYGLIYGNLGMPNLGFNGAAYASIAAELSGLLVTFIVLNKKGVFKQFKLYRFSGLDSENLKRIIRISLPLILQVIISIVSWEFFYLLIEHYGEQELAVSNAMRNIFGLAGCFTWAFAATTNTMVSNIIGQHHYKRVPILLKRILILSIGFAVAVAIIINIFPGFFLSIYAQDDAFIAAAIPVMRVVSVALVMMAASIVFLNAIIGAGDTKTVLYIEVVSIILYCIYVYTVLEQLHLPITYGWASEWLYWMSSLIPSFIYIASKRWTKKINAF